MLNFSDDLTRWLQNWPDGIIILDSQSRIVMLTEKATEISGWTNEKVSGVDVHDILCVRTRNFGHTKEDCPFHPSQLIHAQANLKSGVWLCSDGTNINIDYRLIPVKGLAPAAAFLTFYSNESLLHNQAEMEKLAEYTDKNPSPMAEFDTEGQMLFGNPAMQEALLAFDFSDEGYPNFLPANLSEFCQKIDIREADFSHAEHKVGEQWFSWHFHGIESRGETSVLGYAFEITQQKIAEEEARQARANARRDFYAKMMHELRTPLNAIVGFSDVLLLRSSDSLDEKDQKALRTIKSAGLQLNEMISDTLDISKIEAGKMQVDPEEFNVCNLIGSFKEQMECLASAKELAYLIDCDLENTVYTDQQKLRQILINLISNAIKYTKKGWVHVSISGPHDSTLLQTPVEVMRLCVRDTGVGIPPDQIENLFKAYEQVREDKNKGIQGTGIGLALVYELTQMLGGDIHVDSTYGEGSCFTVELPIKLSVDHLCIR